MEAFNKKIEEANQTSINEFDKMLNSFNAASEMTRVKNKGNL